ncbi:hypothetical protein [uncultured Gammaproteobacteria bacterium]|nr:hypothetical protein [uncultured Gammaproteobacteria bacterium]
MCRKYAQIQKCPPTHKHENSPLHDRLLTIKDLTCSLKKAYKSA